MQFEPKTEQEIKSLNLWPHGDYHFEVARAEDTESKNGNEMIKLTLNVFNNENRTRIVYDYLMAAFPAKLRSCAEACGLLDKYNSGQLNDVDFDGKTGTLTLGIQKDPTKAYPDRNSVVKYLSQDAGVAMQSPANDAPEAPILDDDLPF